MFRSHPVSLIGTSRTFRAIAFLSAVTLGTGILWAQSAPLSWDNANGSASGSASILVTDGGGGATTGPLSAAPLSPSSGCSGDGCYANNNYWQSVGRRSCGRACGRGACRRGGCGLGICAGLSCGGCGCGCCGDGCGVLGGCITADGLGYGQHAMLSSGSHGKRCGEGGCLKRFCDACRDHHRRHRDRCRSRRCAGGTTFCGLPAPPYPVPFRTPEYVGHHQFTYPPMMPHNSLPHYRNIYSFRSGPCGERTTVNWQPSHIKNALRQIHHMFYLPR